jgi:hypothetical protein
MGVLQRGWPASHALTHLHGLSLIDLERNVMFQGTKPDYLILTDATDDGDRVNHHLSGVGAREGKGRG